MVRRASAREKIWPAEANQSGLVRLENGRNRKLVAGFVLAETNGASFPA